MRLIRKIREANVTARNAFWNMLGNICFAIGVGFLSFAGTPLFSEKAEPTLMTAFAVVAALVSWTTAAIYNSRRRRNNDRVYSYRRHRSHPDLHRSLCLFRANVRLSRHATID